MMQHTSRSNLLGYAASSPYRDFRPAGAAYLANHEGRGYAFRNQAT